MKIARHAQTGICNGEKCVILADMAGYNLGELAATKTKKAQPSSIMKQVMMRVQLTFVLFLASPLAPLVVLCGTVS